MGSKSGDEVDPALYRAVKQRGKRLLATWGWGQPSAQRSALARRQMDDDALFEEHRGHILSYRTRVPSPMYPFGLSEGRWMEIKLQVWICLYSLIFMFPALIGRALPETQKARACSAGFAIGRAHGHCGGAPDIGNESDANIYLPTGALALSKGVRPRSIGVQGEGQVLVAWPGFSRFTSCALGVMLSVICVSDNLFFARRVGFRRILG